MVWPYDGRVPYKNYLCCTFGFSQMVGVKENEWFSFAVKMRAWKRIQDTESVEYQLLRCAFKWYVHVLGCVNI